MGTENTVILDGVGVKRALTRIAHEVLERNKGVKDLVLVGIRTGGVYLAHELALRLEEIEGEKVGVGAVDITLYRDDIKGHSEHLPVGKTDIPFSIEGKKVVLVDDVLFTGRTIRLQWMRLWITAGLHASSSRFLWTGAIGICPSEPIS